MSTEGGQWFSALSNNELRERQNVRTKTALDHDDGDGAIATLPLTSMVTNSIEEHRMERARGQVLMLLLPSGRMLEPGRLGTRIGHAETLKKKTTFPLTMPSA